MRRAIQTNTAQALGRQVLDIATATGANLVEVSSHPGARPSHAVWHGRVYMLEGSSPEYPNFYDRCMPAGSPQEDLVEGYGGYNRYHTMRIYHEGEAQR